jgi:hypothetical protein
MVNDPKKTRPWQDQEYLIFLIHDTVQKARFAEDQRSSSQERSWNIAIHGEKAMTDDQYERRKIFNIPDSESWGI